MDIRRIPLRFVDGVACAIVREPTGADELVVASSSTFAAVGLIDGTLVEYSEGSLPRGGAARLVAADRDQVLAALHDLCFGDLIASTLACSTCRSPFDFNFSLAALCRHVAEQATTEEMAKLPSGADEIAVSALPAGDAEKALARRCLGDAAGDDDIARFGERLARAAPMVSLELDAACPECRHVNPVPFDMQGFFLSRLLGARASLMRDVHRLAAAYHWSPQQILALPRTLRRSFVTMIDAERTPRRAAVWRSA